MMSSRSRFQTWDWPEKLALWQSAPMRWDGHWRCHIPIGETRFVLFRHAARPKRNGKSMEKEYDFSKGKQGPIRSHKGKTRITIYLDDDILDAYRRKGDDSGRGYQTLINEALQQSINKKSTALDAKTLRRILREEIRKAGSPTPEATKRQAQTATLRKSPRN